MYMGLKIEWIYQVPSKMNEKTCIILQKITED